MKNPEKYLKRSFELGLKAGKSVGSNPRVGAVIVANNKIIGEGWHQIQGKEHAEIHALKSVKSEHFELVKKSTIFVSLEPCAHYGNTGPCAEAIVKAGIPKVHIGLVDPSDRVNGKGIQLLRDAGIEVTIAKKSNAALQLTDHFLIKEQYNRPKILLKFAQSSDGFLGKTNESTWLTNAMSRRLVHRYRSQYGAILVGTNTALIDNPGLDTRFGFGAHPLRIIPDFQGRIPKTHKIFQDRLPTWILSYQDHPLKHQVDFPNFINLDPKQDFYTELFDRLKREGIYTLIVEGGATILNNFIAENHWDQALVFTAPLQLSTGIKAPEIKGAELIETTKIGFPGAKEGLDTVQLFRNPKQPLTI